MNYKKIYDNLVFNATTRSIIDGEYYESHHIIPKCMGGSNDKDNLALLTPEEHYLAHQLLVKIYPHINGLAYATLKMTVGNKNSRYGNKLYGWIRRKVAVDNSNKMKEYLKNNPHPRGMLGKNHSLETKKQQSKSIKQAMVDNGLCTTVYQFNMNGILIGEFDSLSTAAKSVDGRPSNIKYTAEGKYRYAHGYRWSYTPDNLKPLQDKKLVGNKGKMWISNDNTEITIDKNLPVPEGWKLGRVSKKGYK